MNSNYDNYLNDPYAEYADEFDPMAIDRQARRKRKKDVNYTPKKSDDEIIDEIAAETDAIDNLSIKTTYTPSEFEAEWLLQSLRTFFDQKLIVDVLGQVKGGKEASVYRCETPDGSLLAAKVYRPRKFRQLRNDSMYREGRQILKANGEALDGRDDRIVRAIGKKSAFGEQVAHTSWLTYELVTLRTLSDYGADVPKPVAAGENAILMQYIGDEGIAAPILNSVRLEREEAAMMFQRVLWNIEVMLQHDMIHGDLSAYNILYWDGDITLIDFPQVTNPHTNSNARAILERDVQRVCDYFRGQGVDCDAAQISAGMWDRYFAPDPEQYAADLSRMEYERQQQADDDDV